MSKYFIQGKGQVDLTQNDFVFEGGEGKIFSKGLIAYKIYTDLNKMIPMSKIQELSVLNKNNIIGPKDLILNKNNKAIGFTMDLVHGVSFARLFTNDFRNTNHVLPESTVKLVENMVESIVFIHDKKCLMVDGNEMNYLADDKNFEIPYFIDVNSYQTPSFPATVIMPSVRDWKSKIFSTLTDWFSFAIVSCQLFIGIHPFKGYHPSYKQGQMIEKMKNNISIFNKDVHIPSSCRDFSYIPDELREWYIKLFEKGERIPPPKVIGLLNVIQTKSQIIQTTDNFEIKFDSQYKDEIIKVLFYNGIKVVTSKNKIWINKLDYSISSSNIDTIFLPKSLDPIFVKINNNFLELFNLKTKEIIETKISCTDKMIINNTIYVRFEGNLIELSLYESNKIIPSIKHIWNIMPKSSIVLNGIIYQNVLGKAYLVIPKPEIGRNSSCQTVYIPELDGYRIINAKYENGVCMISAIKNHTYDKIIIRFDGNKYECKIINDVIDQSINFVVLDNGICVSITHDGLVEMFSNNLKSNKVNVINDPDINSSMVLCKDGTRVMFYRNKELYSIKMKK